jgi:hypothetical protein
MSTQTSGQWAGFFGGLNDLIMTGVDGYTNLEIAKLQAKSGRVESTANMPETQDVDPNNPPATGFLSGVTRDQWVMVGGAVVVGGLLYAALK